MKKIFIAFIKKNSGKDSYLWNFVSSLMFGFQSVIFLMVLTRMVSMEDAGAFTIAYANASLLLFVGKYGVRNYQVSDVHLEHTFGEYKAARKVTVGIMLAASMGRFFYSLAVKGYPLRKSLILLLVCLLKIPDAVEDVYFGEFQRKGRLDVAAKVMSVRLGLTIGIFILSVVLTGNLLYALAAGIGASFLVLWMLLKWTVPFFEMDQQAETQSVMRILRNCLPLFAGSFLSQYISNAPKYAIDIHLSDTVQACYGFISMPVFAIGLLNNVIFAPVIYQMAKLWKQRQKKLFVRRFLLQTGIVGCITCICMSFAYLFGIPILSLLYHTDLSEYKNELMVLLLGGGFLALVGLLHTTVTILRFQYALLVGYGAVAFLAFVILKKSVAVYGVMGAAWSYTGLMAFLCLLFFALLFVGILHPLKHVDRINLEI